MTHRRENSQGANMMFANHGQIPIITKGSKPSGTAIQVYQSNNKNKI